MPTTDPFPAGVDPAHVWAVARKAAPSIQHDGTVLLVGGRYPARIVLPDPLAANEAEAALRLVGYQVSRTRRSIRGRDLNIEGWSLEGLERRLTAMREVLGKLAAGPGVSAYIALELGRLPAAMLPSRAHQQLLIERASELLRAFISRTSGIHAPRDPRADPDDPRAAFRLAATWRAEEAIDHIAGRHLQITKLAVVSYPTLRKQMDHATARDSAIRRANLAVSLIHHLRPAEGTPPSRPSDQSPRAAASEPSAPPAAVESSQPGTTPRPRFRIAKEFPAGTKPPTPISRPATTKGRSRPGGRTFPSGRPRRR
jgi:hypothetical protein